MKFPKLGPVKEMVSGDFWKTSAIIAGGALAVPLVAGPLTAMINKLAKRELIPSTGWTAKGVDLVTAGLVAALVAAITKKPQVGRYVLLGGVAGVVNNVVSEKVLTKLPGVSDYLRVTSGRRLSDYLRLPKRSGMAEWATAGQMAKARTAVSVGEKF
jgi:di/tricarboxylate transporter